MNSTTHTTSTFNFWCMMTSEDVKLQAVLEVYDEQIAVHYKGDHKITNAEIAAITGMNHAFAHSIYPPERDARDSKIRGRYFQALQDAAEREVKEVRARYLRYHM